MWSIKNRPAGAGCSRHWGDRGPSPRHGSPAVVAVWASRWRSRVIAVAVQVLPLNYRRDINDRHLQSRLRWELLCAAGCDSVLGAEEELVGEEVWRLLIGLGGRHMGTRARTTAAGAQPPGGELCNADGEVAKETSRLRGLASNFSSRFDISA